MRFYRTRKTNILDYKINRQVTKIQESKKFKNMNKPTTKLQLIKNKNHSFFMQKAMQQAKVALKKEEVPVGAVVVDSNGNILSRGHNKIESVGCHTAHAEIIAIQKACKKIGDWRLDNCWIYVTLEPCLMCFGLIRLCRLKGLIFGAKSDLFGFGFQKINLPKQYNKKLLISRLKENECIDILKEFFKKIRKRERLNGEAKIRSFRKSQKKDAKKT